MIIARHLVKETLKTQLGVFFVLMFIFTTFRFVRVLSDASEGELPTDFILSLLAVYIPALSTLVLPISCFIGIMLSHGKLHIDSEMVVLKACGISEWYVVRVMLVLGLALGAMTAYITFVLAPNTIKQEFELKAQATNEAGVSSIIPGRFQYNHSSGVVLFAHRQQNENQQLEKVFLARSVDDSGKLDVVYANSAQLEVNSDGTRMLNLYGGTQYDGRLDGEQFQVMAFDTYMVTISRPDEVQPRDKMAAKSNQELLELNTPEALAEFQWRIIIPLSIPILSVIAVPLAMVNPRQGRFGRMVPGLILYLTYFLSLLAARRFVEEGLMPPDLGLWWVPATMILVALSLVLKERSLGLRLRSALRKKQPHAAPANHTSTNR